MYTLLTSQDWSLSRGKSPRGPNSNGPSFNGPSFNGPSFNGTKAALSILNSIRPSPDGANSHSEGAVSKDSMPEYGLSIP